MPGRKWSERAIDQQIDVNRDFRALEAAIENQGGIGARGTLVRAKEEIPPESVGVFSFLRGTPGSTLSQIGQARMYNTSLGFIQAGSTHLAVPVAVPGAEAVAWAVVPSTTIAEDVPKADVVNVCKIIDELESNGVLPAGSISTLRTCFGCVPPATTTVTCSTCTQGDMSKDVNVTITGVKRAIGLQGYAWTDPEAFFNATHEFEFTDGQCISTLKTQIDETDANVAQTVHTVSYHLQIEHGISFMGEVEELGWFVKLQVGEVINGILTSTQLGWIYMFIATGGDCSADRRLLSTHIYREVNQNAFGDPWIDVDGITVLIEPQ